MTLSEFREQTHLKLKSCNSKTEINSIIIKADSVLKSSNISTFNQRQFWTELYHDLEHVGPVFERQSATSLSVIISLAQQSIANHLANFSKT